MSPSPDAPDLDAVPDEGGKSAEYELAEQDAQADRSDAQRAEGDREGYVRPDLRPAPGSRPADGDEVRDAEAQLDRVITK